MWLHIGIMRCRNCIPKLSQWSPHKGIWICCTRFEDKCNSVSNLNSMSEWGTVVYQCRIKFTFNCQKCCAHFTITAGCVHFDLWRHFACTKSFKWSYLKWKWVQYMNGVLLQSTSNFEDFCAWTEMQWSIRECNVTCQGIHCDTHVPVFDNHKTNSIRWGKRVNICVVIGL